MELLSEYPQRLLSVLETSFSGDNFEHSVLTEFNSIVPLLCAPKQSPNPDQDYALCVEKVFVAFEEFICNRRPIDTVAEELQKLAPGGSSFCGHIFKAWEPTYSCRDCAMDPTCVFCRTCFVQSDHVRHNYKMHTSQGGGYCDCGDAEAWRSSPWCRTHLAAKMAEGAGGQEGEAEISARLALLPSDLRDRAERLFCLLVRTFVQVLLSPDEANAPVPPLSQIHRPLLTNVDLMEKKSIEEESWATNHRLPSPMTLRPSDRYVVVLYNNEYHNYDEVISTLNRVLKCDKQAAAAFATVVDRDGRSIVRQSVMRRKACEDCTKIMGVSNTISHIPIQCRCHHPDLIALENFLVHSLRWISAILTRVPPLRPLVCPILLGRPTSGRWTAVSPRIETIVTPMGDEWMEDGSFLAALFRMYTNLWKSARKETVNCVMGILLKEVYFKKIFAIEYIKHYDLIAKGYIYDDHNEEDTLKNLTCQIFTVISLARLLIEEQHALSGVLKPLQLMISNSTVPASWMGPNANSHRVLIKPPPEQNHGGHLSKNKFETFERHFRVLHDLEFLLFGFLSDPVWTERTREEFLAYFAGLVGVLTTVQDMNGMIREADVHVEEEMEWMTAFAVTYYYCDSLAHTVKLAGSDEAVLFAAIDIVRKAYESRVASYDRGFLTDWASLEAECTVVNYDVATQRVSVIQPLPRLLAALYGQASAHFAHRGITWASLGFSGQHDVTLLLERPLQVMVFISQAAANYWVRNGAVVPNSIQQLYGIHLSGELIFRDYQLIQQVAAAMPPDQFILRLIHKFGLGNYVRQELVPSSTRDSRLKPQLVEDMLRLLLIVVSHRHVVGVGQDVTEEAVQQHDLLHILCQQSLHAHSELVKMISSGKERAERIIMAHIDQVADRVSQNQRTFFRAKQSLVETQFNRFHPRYRQIDRNNADEVVRQHLKRSCSELGLPPPVPPAFLPPYRPLLALLRCRTFVRLLSVLLDIALTKPGVTWWSELTVDLLLNLIGVALHEDQRDGSAGGEFPFLTAASPKESTQSDNCLLARLEHLADRPLHEEHADLLRWTLRKWHEVARLQQQRAAGIIPGETDRETSGVVDAADGEMMEEGVGQVVADEDRWTKVVAGEGVERKDTPQQEEKKRRVEAARLRRERVMAKMSSMQRRFISMHPNLVTPPSPQTDDVMEEVEGSPRPPRAQQQSQQEEYQTVAVGLGRQVVRPNPASITCTLCLEDVSEDDSKQTMLVCAYLCRSNVLVSSSCSGQANDTMARSDSEQVEEDIPDEMEDDDEVVTQPHRNTIERILSMFGGGGEDSSGGTASSRSSELDTWHERPLLATLSHPEGSFVSLCGHTMHQACKEKYAGQLKQKTSAFNRRVLLGANFEFRCPLCKSVSNLDLPVMPPLASYSSQLRAEEGGTAFSDWLASTTEWLRVVKAGLQEMKDVEKKPDKLRKELSQLLRSHAGRITSKSSRSSNEVHLPPLAPAFPIPGSGSKVQTNLLTGLSHWIDRQGHLIPIDQLNKPPTGKTPASYENGSNHRELRAMRHSLAYTIAVWERALRTEDRTFFTRMPERHAAGLAYLLRACLIAHAHQSIDLALLTDAIAVYDALLVSGQGSVNSPVLKLDCFFLLVALMMMRVDPFDPAWVSGGSGSGPFTFPLATGNSLDGHLVRICAAAQLVQALLFEQQNVDAEAEIPASAVGGEGPFSGHLHELIHLSNRLRSTAHLPPTTNADLGPRLAVHVRDSMLPFLRSASFLLYHITGIEPPEILKGIAAAAASVPQGCCDRWTEYRLLCAYLDLPDNMADLIAPSGALHTLVDVWCGTSSPSTQTETAAGVGIVSHRNILRYHPISVPRLVDLPRDYTDLLAMAATYQCRDKMDASLDPTLCLVCGQVVCFQGYCCRQLEGREMSVYGAQLHTRRHHAGYAVLLRLHGCRIVVFTEQARRLGFRESPYKDQFGEPDLDLRRGNPLFLDVDSYARLQSQWLNHTLATTVTAETQFQPAFMGFFE